MRNIHGASTASTTLDVVSAVRVVTHYYAAVAPQVRGELRRWQARAETIPDPVLRSEALSKLGDERLNAEAAATFAVLAPRRHRTDLIRLTVAFQVMYDYLDAVSEHPVEDPLRNGLRLHEALVTAIDPDAPPVDFYAFDRDGDDGGYLRSLTDTCREAFGRLPAGEAVLPLLRRACRRCGSGQSRTHAVDATGVGQLERWATRTSADRTYAWWELAAGAASSLALHALFAAAADPRTGPRVATQVDAAYFPSVCALSTLLDSLVDHHEDTRDGSHSYVAYYSHREHATMRIAAIADEAASGTRRLPSGRRHAVIATGVACFYLSNRRETRRFCGFAHDRITQPLGPISNALIVLLRLRRFVAA